MNKLEKIGIYRRKPKYKDWFYATGYENKKWDKYMGKWLEEHTVPELTIDEINYLMEIINTDLLFNQRYHPYDLQKIYNKLKKMRR